ncbi:AAA family ATPase [Streptomyces sp. NPDC003635]
MTPSGRDEQLTVIRAALAGIRSAGTSLLLRGDPGMGKTALLEEAGTVARGAGLRVLRMTGAAAESSLAHAALHQVLWPLLEHVPDLPAGQRDALESALGLHDGAAPHTDAVAGAALALLARAAADRPVVVLQDDLQWADPASLGVFKRLRRLTAALPVVIIGATRDPAAEGAIDLPPLTEIESERLLRALHPWLPEGARERVLRAAGGNPLALHELPARIRKAATDHPAYLAGPRTAGTPDLFVELPLGERLGRLYEDGLRALPAAARHLLLAVALGGPPGQHADLVRNMDSRTRQSVEASALAHLDGDRLAFRHPLVRAGLIHLATPGERRAAHRLLAESLPATSPHRLVHLAAAAVGTDAGLADLVHQEADRIAAEGEDAAAARLMGRAAGLSPDPATRSARLVAAAVMATRGGRMRLAAELLTEAETEARPGRPEPGAAYAYVLACTRFQLAGDPLPTVELLPGFLDEAAELRDAMLLLLLLAAVHTGDERARAAVERHTADTGGPATLCLRAWTGPHPGPYGELSRAVGELPRDRETATAWILLWSAAAVDAVGEHDTLHGCLARSRAYAPQAFLDSLRAHDDYLHGRWEESLALSRQGAETAAAYRHALNETLFLLNTAQILAARGDLTGLTELEPVLGTAARERQLRLVAERFQALKVLGALGHGRTQEAWHHARALPPATAPWSHLSLVDWVQAAVDNGRHDEARERLRGVREAGLAAASPHHSFLVAVAEALVAQDEEHFAAVYGCPGSGSWPFPLARAHLAHARLLRRHGRPEQAAAHGTEARRLFTRLGATPWARQAGRELDLAAAGSDARLSAQELRIAELAAEGLTNRQIGERLGLSPRTVGAHLYRIFPKLSITTRAGVARALQQNRRPAAPAPEPPAK